MRIFKFTSYVVALMLLVNSNLSAEVIHFQAQLNQDWSEHYILYPLGGTGTSATGVLNFDLDTDANLIFNLNLSVTGIFVEDLMGSVTQRSQIHPSGDGIHLVNVGEMGFVNTLDGMEVVGGSENITDFAEASILSGTSWVNVHTSLNPFGEIAGVITAVPLPGTLLMFISGLAGLVLTKCRIRG